MMDPSLGRRRSALLLMATCPWPLLLPLLLPLTPFVLLVPFWAATAAAPAASRFFLHVGKREETVSDVIPDAKMFRQGAVRGKGRPEASSCGWNEEWRHGHHLVESSNRLFFCE